VCVDVNSAMASSLALTSFCLNLKIFLLLVTFLVFFLIYFVACLFYKFLVRFFLSMLELLLPNVFLFFGFFLCLCYKSML
jgi:hypothetical protein